MKCIIVLSLVFVLIGERWPDCVSGKRVFASGVYFGTPVAGELDSEAAKNLMEHQAIGDSTLGAYDQRPLITELLRFLSRKFSYDFSVLYFLRRSYYNNPHERRLYDSLLSDHTDSLERLKKYTIVFIPGLAYKSDTTTGADFARQRRLLSQKGIENILVQIDEWGLVDNNASIIRRTIDTLRHRPLILVSASKGGLETLIALHNLNNENVRAWISIGGILHGTPIADQYLSWPKSWLASVMLLFQGGNDDVVEDISHSKRNERFNSVHVSPAIKVIHYVGVPLTFQVSSEVEGRFCDLLDYGPNDGLTPVADELVPNGIIIADVGLDHYYRALDIDRRTIALARMTASILEH